MSRKITTDIYLSELILKNPSFFSMFDYSETVYVKSSQKIHIKCNEHGYFSTWPKDHMNGLLGCKKCATIQRKKTNIERYGVENIFQRVDIIQQAMYKKHGVSNPGMMSDHVDKMVSTNIKNFGVPYPIQNDDIKNKIRNTNISIYGVPYCNQNSAVTAKMMETKIKNGSFTKSNSSKEATEYIIEYITKKGYDFTQCAFANYDGNIHEWGIYHLGKWVLFDLVVFEPSHRGDKNYIIEILEYHGPFHYTEDICMLRGDDPAYPWKTNKTTIRESVENDKIKYDLAKSLTEIVTIIWSPKYHTKNNT